MNLLIGLPLLTSSGKLVARRGGVRFLLTDHLGSVNVVLNANGNGRSRLRYDPWGKQRYVENITPTGYRYTAQRFDDKLGLYDYQARYYDAHIGRFISADIFVQDPANPQNYSRYTYVLNNPLIYTDPTGYLTAKEMEDYFGYSSLDAAIAGLGEKLAYLLWNTSVTWGDVIRYDEGDALIALLSDSNTIGRGVQHFRGGFFGVTGARSGYEVSRDELKNSELITLNGEMANRLRNNGYQDLYVARDGEFSYGSTTVQIGMGNVANWVGVIGLGALIIGLVVVNPVVAGVGAAATIIGGGLSLLDLLDNHLAGCRKSIF
jgi:RHS repeat-associated protein